MVARPAQPEPAVRAYALRPCFALLRRYAPYCGLAAALLALVALVVVARSDSNDDPTSIQPPTISATTGPAKTGPTTTSPPPPSPYELAPTRRCLRSAGVEVSAVRSTDSRLRALGDLAQRTSLELKFGGGGWVSRSATHVCSGRFCSSRTTFTRLRYVETCCSCTRRLRGEAALRRVPAALSGYGVVHVTMSRGSGLLACSSAAIWKVVVAAGLAAVIPCR